MADGAGDPLRPVGRSATPVASLGHSVDELFYPDDATPRPARLLSADVRSHLLDEWEWVRKDPPASKAKPARGQWSRPSGLAPLPVDCPRRGVRPISPPM